METKTIAERDFYTGLRQRPGWSAEPALVHVVFMQTDGTDTEGRRTSIHEVAADVLTAAQHYVMPAYQVYENFEEDVSPENPDSLDLMEYIADARLIRLLPGLTAHLSEARFAEPRSYATCEEWLTARRAA